MLLYMTEPRDFMTASGHALLAGVPMLDLMPYRGQELHGYEASLDSPTLSEMTNNYATLQCYQPNQGQNYSIHLPSGSCDEVSPRSTAGTMELFHLHTFQQVRPRASFEDNQSTCQLLDAGRRYLDSDPIQHSACYLSDSLHAHELSPLPSTSTLETTNHDLFHTPYSESVAPYNGSPSPTI